MKKSIFGALICCTSGGVMNVKSIKRFLDYLAKMGYNYLELCMEDLYKIEDEPYFGYLRGGYSKEEMHEIVEYAENLGIEIVPAIQTLAHLNNLTKLPMFSDIVDIDDILLIDEDRTYELIEKMFKTLRTYFKTDKVNIGFDEAHNVGLGKYLDKHGYTKRIDLLVKHLHRVAKIAEKYGFKPHMWSDMFFRLINKGNYYGKDLHIPAESIAQLPENIEIVYWHYEDTDSELYDAMFKSHLETNREIWFANAAVTHNGFAPFNNRSIESGKVAYKSASKFGINKYIATLWGNNGNECSYFNALPSLYAFKQFHEGNYDMEKIKEGFKDLFKVDFDKFMLLDIPNKTPKNPDVLNFPNPCKSLFYNDCFLGLKDDAVKQEGHIPYDEYATTLRNVSKDMNEFRPYFEEMSLLCTYLSYKAELGVKTREAYIAKDKKTLKKLIKQYDLAYKSLKKFHKVFEKCWLTDNKHFYWEIHEHRLGGQESRILFCKNRLKDYIKGKIDSIEELELPILPYANWGLQYNGFAGSISPSSI